MTTARNARQWYAGMGLCVGFCTAMLTGTGCQSRQLIVHGSSGIISHDAQLQLGRLAIGTANEQDVLAILGRPSSTVLADDGSRTLHYTCVVTTLKTRYLFSPRATMATGQETGIHRCAIGVGQDGRVRDVDYQTGRSDSTMHSTPLPRSS